MHPAVTATWAPRGQTPVLRHRFSSTRIAMSAALAYRPGRSQATLVFQPKHDSHNTDSPIKSPTDRHDHLDGDPVTPIWDGLPTHRPKAMKA
ncbi:hypothetical protein [Saccharopolyspora pogona]|uniref:hypothetical protein n=1 Tax=Saccharopolyspora pogona TaxID=333966 RepID=UPI0016844105|nr:hypothetical protein [Saccharopolyspora pogona]